MKPTCFTPVTTIAAAACAAAMLITTATPAFAQEATRLSGVGYFAEAEDCDWESVGADFALLLTGDLEGCLFVFVDTATYTPSGTYVETGTELFVSEEGSFETVYRFEAKYEDAVNLLGEIFGRCQHVIVEESGTGVFAGVRGRIDFKDDIEAGEFPYRGSLKYAE